MDCGYKKWIIEVWYNIKQRFSHPEYFIKKYKAYPSEILHVGDILKVSDSDELVKVVEVRIGEPTCLMVEKI